MEAKTVDTSIPNLGRKTSTMWFFFTIIDDNQAKCKNCNKILSYKSSTSNLKKHLKKSHPSLFDDLISGRIPSSHKGKGNTSEYVSIERSFEVDLVEPFSENDEACTPRKKTKFQAKSEQKSLRPLHPKPALARNIVHNYAKLNPMVEYDTNSDNDEEDNEFELLGKFICSQLQKLSKVNAFLAQEEIQSVLTRYKVHELSTEEKSKMMSNTKQ